MARTQASKFCPSGNNKLAAVTGARSREKIPVFCFVCRHWIHRALFYSRVEEENRFSVPAFYYQLPNTKSQCPKGKLQLLKPLLQMQKVLSQMIPSQWHQPKKAKIRQSRKLIPEEEEDHPCQVRRRLNVKLKRPRNQYVGVVGQRELLLLLKQRVQRRSEYC